MKSSEKIGRFNTPAKKTSNGVKTLAIITAAGKGKRMGSVIKKPYLILDGKPLLAHAIMPFEQSKAINGVIIVTAKGDEGFCLKNIVKRFGFKKVLKVIRGGKQRQDSVMSGIMAAGNGWDMVVVHDGVRPFVAKEAIEKVVKSAAQYGAATLAVPVKDTIKQVSCGFVKKTLPRDELWAIQTPQAFGFHTLKKAHVLAKKQGFIGTDDSILVERHGCKVAVVTGS
ncbi:MAG: 2-C-methyl-D-erythritol 4-phosphate cytidylyltransferase, partial [Deltaproteobacteria bacterium]|nr:2-C-methyl-D-erythritol 4-phosphate cytidylyltransferase [Deltaproteobacteria bacterium]